MKHSSSSFATRNRSLMPAVAGEIVENWKQLREGCGVRWGVDTGRSGENDLRTSFLSELRWVLGAVDAAVGVRGTGGMVSAGGSAGEGDRATSGEAEGPERASMLEILPEIRPHGPVVAALNTGAEVAVVSSLPADVTRRMMAIAGVDRCVAVCGLGMFEGRMPVAFEAPLRSVMLQRSGA